MNMNIFCLFGLVSGFYVSVLTIWYVLLVGSLSTSVAISSQAISTAHAGSAIPRVRNRQPIPTSSIAKPSSTPIHPIRRIPLQPPGQFHTPKVNHTNRRTRHSTQKTIHQRTRINMASISTPARRQRRTRIPPHRKHQRQTIPNRNLRIP